MGEGRDRLCHQGARPILMQAPRRPFPPGHVGSVTDVNHCAVLHQLVNVALEQAGRGGDGVILCSQEDDRNGELLHHGRGRVNRVHHGFMLGESIHLAARGGAWSQHLACGCGPLKNLRCPADPCSFRLLSGKRAPKKESCSYLPQQPRTSPRCRKQGFVPFAQVACAAQLLGLEAGEAGRQDLLNFFRVALSNSALVLHFVKFFFASLPH